MNENENIFTPTKMSEQDHFTNLLKQVSEPKIPTSHQLNISSVTTPLSELRAQFDKN